MNEREHYCCNCGREIGVIRPGKRRMPTIMLCQSCQQYDVPGAGEYRVGGGDGEPVLEWIKNQFRREMI
jgi:hypothetical protein